MATQQATQADPVRPLRRVLQANGVFTTASSVALIAGAAPIGSFIGLDSPLILVAIGIMMLPYAVWLLWPSTRQSLVLVTGVITAILDAAWVVASGAILLGGWLPLTTEGKWAVAIVADIVATFALAEFYAVRQARSNHIDQSLPEL